MGTGEQAATGLDALPVKQCQDLCQTSGGIDVVIDNWPLDDYIRSRFLLVTENPVDLRDLQALVLHLLGLDPWKLTYLYQGLQQRLIRVEGKAKIHKPLLARVIAATPLEHG